MKKSICLYFQVHQPTRLRLYRFFDIGKDSHYYDDFTNRAILKRIAEKCYLPMNELLLKAIKETKGKFKLAFSISGSALEQFDRYAPEVVESFRRLAETGSVEFLCETYNHTLASLASKDEFKHQVLKHKAAIEEHFGVTPKVFRNTELIYSDSIGCDVLGLGFKTMLTEGARHIMGWKSPNYVYNNVKSDGEYLADLYTNNFVNNRVGTALETNFRSNAQYFSDYYLENASFLKIDNITLSYRIKLCNALDRDMNLDVFATVQNVCTITKYSGIDPEIFSGIDNNLYPRPRTYIIGVKFNF